MKKRPKVIKFISAAECNKLLAYVKKNYFVLFRKKSEDEPFQWYAFIEDLRTNLKISLKIGGHAVTYVTKKDREEVDQVVTGVHAYQTLCCYTKIPKIKKVNEVGSAIPLLYYNPNYNETRNYAYSYDLNSAYSDAMTGPMPDTSKIVGKLRKVNKGEIGFIEVPTDADIMLMAKNNLIMVGPGNYAEVIFNEMPSPFIRFVDVWYNRKKNAKNRAEKIKAKGILNYSVGYLQLVNPYIRATIVTRCNKRISSLIDENTLYANTDSIVSLVPRPELKTGSELGEWKLEHQGLFAYRQFNYQWDYDIPTYRGVPKKWFPDGWDLLNDPLPESDNIYELDKELLKLRRKTNEKKAS